MQFIIGEQLKLPLDSMMAKPDNALTDRQTILLFWIMSLYYKTEFKRYNKSLANMVWITSI